MAPTGCCRFRSGVRVMTASARLHFCDSGTLVVYLVLSRHIWSRYMTSCRMSKLSSLISDEKVETPGSSVSIIADLPIGIVIIPLQQDYSMDISYL